MRTGIKFTVYTVIITNKTLFGMEEHNWLNFVQNKLLWLNLDTYCKKYSIYLYSITDHSTGQAWQAKVSL